MRQPLLLLRYGFSNQEGSREIFLIFFSIPVFNERFFNHIIFLPHDLYYLCNSTVPFSSRDDITKEPWPPESIDFLCTGSLQISSCNSHNKHMRDVLFSF